MKSLQLSTLFSFFIIFGCSTSDDIEPEEELFDGNFELALTGDDSRNMVGMASFVHGIITTKSEVENGSSLAIILTNKTNEDELISILVGQIGDLDGINTGTYNINLEPDEGDPLVNVGAYLNGSITTFLGLSGKVTITKIQNDIVEGNISVVLDNLNGNIIDMSGEFTALGITEKI